MPGPWLNFRLSAILLLALVSSHRAQGDDLSPTERIIKDIFANYNKDVKPTGASGKGPVKVTINLIPLHFHINPETSTLSSHVWFVQSWKDGRLKWNSRSYDNTSIVHVDPDKVWKPDIMVYNSVEHFDYEVTDVILVSLGHSWWIPPVNLHTSCDLDWTYWPWDKQACTLQISSWTKSGWDLDVETIEGNFTTMSKQNFQPGAWDLETGSLKRHIIKFHNNSEDFYVEIEANVVLTRRSWLDKKVGVMPLFVSCCLILATFWIHPACDNRFKLNLVAILILIITVLALRLMLPSVGGQLPLVVLFNTALLVLAIIQLILIILLSNLVARRDKPSVRLLTPLQTLAPFLCLGNVPFIGQIMTVVPPWAGGGGTDTARLEPGSAEAATDDESHKPVGWNLVAQTVDRLCFLLYLVIIVLSLASYLGPPSVSPKVPTS